MPEKRQKQTDILEAEAQAKAVLLSLGEGLVVMDKEGKIILINTEAEVLTGWKNEEVVGKLTTDVFPKEDEKGDPVAFNEIVLQKVLSGEKFSIDAKKPYWLVRRDGTRFPVSIVVTPIRLAGGITGAVDVFRDITKDYEMETAKNEFISLASHQLRTPLSTVAWYAEMLLAGDAGAITEEQKSFLEEIYQGNHRMISLVNALLNVSRIETSTLFVGNETVDVKAVIDVALQDLAVLIQKNKVTIQKDYPKDHVELQADKKIISIIVQNIISNAIKYTPEGGTVTIGLSTYLGQPTFKVADTGYGIPKEQQGEIFTKLFRADNIQSVVTEGTGLGLYMVKKILEKLGGKIWFESEENKGTTFYVTWPKSGMREQRGSKHLSINKGGQN
jgi:PAS domain S-box-containing protein